MATAAPSPLASSVEKTNGNKLGRLLIDGGTTVLRKAFDGRYPPTNLITALNANYSILNNLLRRRVLNGHQWDKLFPPVGVAPDSKTFDITLLFLLLTNICGLTPPPSGWHTKPPASDTSHEANLARVKFYRNILYGHVTTTGVDTPIFSTLWTEISGVLVSLGLDQAEVDRLKAEKGGEQDYIDVLVDWADSEEDIKSQLRNLHQVQGQTHQAVEDARHAQVKLQKSMEDIRQTQAMTQKTVEDIHQTQAKTQITVEDIHQTQAKTQKTVENIHQTQAKTQTIVEDIHQTQGNTQKTVEDIRQTQAKTKTTVEDVRYTLDKTQHCVEEVAASLKEIKDSVQILKNRTDRDMSDEVLRNLAKWDFRGDIDDYVERFQPGTREWVFDRVQNWLDDRSSQHRVMVISGKAGMGKSVISAVICKRMEEAGRLAGNHFCQYNNVSYCKPQLMIQSLACHLSHALSEYRSALVKQLSRNLGTDLNNKGLEDLFALLLKEPLNAVADPGRNMLMVIDALDESEYEGKNELLDVIENQFCKLPKWIRFLVTTRPAAFITEQLKHLNPFELQTEDKNNLADVRLFCQKKLEHLNKARHVEEFVEKLVSISEGLMLVAHFLINYIKDKNAFPIEGDLDASLPLGISSVYRSYFNRLQRDLKDKLGIEEERLLLFLSAISASREPLPVGFASKVLVRGTNPMLLRRKVLEALECVSSLLPIRDDCLHVFHKSVKDWLTDISCYGEHYFTVDEDKGHLILGDLCIGELDDIKRKGVHGIQFSATERYALYHGAHHMLHQDFKREQHKLDELTKAYIIDLEIVYAKTFVSSAIAAEDLLWLKTQGIYTFLSNNNKSILNSLLLLLRKYLNRFTDAPHMFLQTILNQGEKVLSVEASNLLQNKHPEIAYMEDVHKKMQQGGVFARFKCSSDVICLDVSPQLDYMVCECNDGMLQLWSLHTGRLVWTRPVIVEKSFKPPSSYARNVPSVNVDSLFRSVVFHPKRERILPGILSQAYTMDGELKPLFPGSNCRFSVCSVSGDKTKILTDYLECSKCLVLWSLENGSEIDRLLEDEDILSFAWSGDGRFLAISHSSAVISLVYVMKGFRKLTQIATQEVCGMVKFSPDHQFIWCGAVKGTGFPHHFSVSVEKETQNTFSLPVGSLNDCGFLFGDLLPPRMFSLGPRFQMAFDLNKKYLLRVKWSAIEMVEAEYEDKHGYSLAAATGIALSLDGQIVYVAGFTSVTAYDVFSGKRKAEINLEKTTVRPLCPVKGGVLIVKSESDVELWSDNLYKCIKTWNNLSEVWTLIPISGERVAAVEGYPYNLTVLDTSNEKGASTVKFFQRGVCACNSKCQLLIDKNYSYTTGPRHCSPWSLQLFDGTTVVWEKEGISRHPHHYGVAFSPTEQFLVVGTNEGMLVLDAETGNSLRTLPSFSIFSKCAFISEDACVIYADYFHILLLNIISGELLSEIDVESKVTCLAACPFNGVLAIGLRQSEPNFQVIRVHLPQGEDHGNGRRYVSCKLGYCEERIYCYSVIFLSLVKI